MRKLAADIIFPITSAPLQQAVLLVDDDGRIADIASRADFPDATLEIYRGALVPGFVNTHCHLELSHLRDVIPRKTGLPAFLAGIMRRRKDGEEAIVQAMEIAEHQMLDKGIVAVADICNTAGSFRQKTKRNLLYHSFIELIGFDPAGAEAVFRGGQTLLAEAQRAGLHASLAPHAPYSVSARLIESISGLCLENGSPTSIHLLESNDENELYMRGTGAYRNLYRDLGLDISFFKPSGMTSLETLLPHFNPNVKTLMVHNTIATTEDIEYAEALHPHLFWCLCPNANLYIEDRLPDIDQLKNKAQHITIGTDSLASNGALDVLAEIKVLQLHFPELPTAELLRWATYNGAVFMNLEHILGSFEAGKQPGVLLLKNFDPETMRLEPCEVQRLL